MHNRLSTEEKIAKSEHARILKCGENLRLMVEMEAKSDLASDTLKKELEEAKVRAVIITDMVDAGAPDYVIRASTSPTRSHSQSPTHIDQILRPDMFEPSTMYRRPTNRAGGKIAPNIKVSKAKAAYMHSPSPRKKKWLEILEHREGAKRRFNNNSVPVSFIKK
jgi:hypothetical protein